MNLIKKINTDNRRENIATSERVSYLYIIALFIIVVVISFISFIGLGCFAGFKIHELLSIFN